MQIPERLGIKETAKLLGVQPMSVSLMLRQGMLPFGVAWKNEAGKWSYLIYKHEVFEFLKNRGGVKSEE